MYRKAFVRTEPNYYENYKILQRKQKEELKQDLSPNKNQYKRKTFLIKMKLNICATLQRFSEKRYLFPTGSFFLKKYFFLLPLTDCYVFLRKLLANGFFIRKQLAWGKKFQTRKSRVLTQKLYNNNKFHLRS